MLTGEGAGGGGGGDRSRCAITSPNAGCDDLLTKTYKSKQLCQGKAVGEVYSMLISMTYFLWKQLITQENVTAPPYPPTPSSLKIVKVSQALY